MIVDNVKENWNNIWWPDLVPWRYVSTEYYDEVQTVLFKIHTKLDSNVIRLAYNFLGVHVAGVFRMDLSFWFRRKEGEEGGERGKGKRKEKEEKERDGFTKWIEDINDMMATEIIGTISQHHHNTTYPT